MDNEKIKAGVNSEAINYVSIGGNAKLTGVSPSDYSNGSVVWAHPQYGVYEGPTFEHKAKKVLAALVRHLDKHGHVHIEENDAFEGADDNSLTTHAIGSDESFVMWVNRLYDELCLVRGEESA